MSEKRELSLETQYTSWEYIKGKMVEYHMEPAEVLHILMNYNTRRDYGEILREIREELKEQEYPKEVVEYLGTEQTGEFVEFDFWMWSKKIDKKYESIIELLLDYKMDAERAKQIFILGLFAAQKVSLSKAAELYGVTIDGFTKILTDLNLPHDRQTIEQLEQYLNGGEELVEKNRAGRTIKINVTDGISHTGLTEEEYKIIEKKVEEQELSHTKGKKSNKRSDFKDEN